MLIPIGKRRLRPPFFIYGEKRKGFVNFEETPIPKARNFRLISMKPIFLFLFLVVLQQELAAQVKQKVVKVYAYVRESHPGAKPNVVKENGSPVQKENINVQSWFIFAEIPKGVSVKITHMTINGQKVPVKTEKQATTPIVFHRPGIGTQVETDSLVPATRNTVFKLVPVPADDFVVAENKQPSIVVVHFTVRGVPHSTRPKEIIRLPALVLQ